MMFDKWKHLFHKKEIEQTGQPEELSLETETLEAAVQFRDDVPEVGDEISTLCEKLAEATYQMEDQRIEYETLGVYFDDISRIEQMPEDKHRELCDIARKIEFLEKNQAEFKQLKIKLSDDKYRVIAKYEHEIPEIMKELSGQEARNAAIKRDMQHLENEKSAQDYYTEEAEDKQDFLRTVAKSVAVMGLISFGVIFWLYTMYEFAIEVTCMVVLFILTLTFVMLYLGYRRESYEIKLAQAKKKRAISLLNKVKLKYVNSTSTLEYIYEKYEIRSLRELEYLWDQYHMLLVETRKFRQSIGDLRVFTDEMERVLRDIHVNDPYIWVQQTRALLDDREMVEVKHSLNVRRQALREQMEHNEETKKQCLLIIKGMVIKEPGLMESLQDILADYQIEF